MRIKELFTVPEGKKVTEKVFGRVLLSSICSILLCMACLASTTWAWFSVSIENTGNVIQIATVTADVEIKYNGNPLVKPTDGKYNLNKGAYELTVTLNNDATDGSTTEPNPQYPVHVLVTVVKPGDAQSNTETKTECYYLTVNSFVDGKGTATGTLGIDTDATVVSFSISWIAPPSATFVADKDVIGTVPTEETESSNENSTEENEEDTGENTGSSEGDTDEGGQETTDPSEGNIGEGGQETTDPSEGNNGEGNQETTNPSEGTDDKDTQDTPDPSEGDNEGSQETQIPPAGNDTDTPTGDDTGNDQEIPEESTGA